MIFLARRRLEPNLPEIELVTFRFSALPQAPRLVSTTDSSTLLASDLSERERERERERESFFKENRQNVLAVRLYVVDWFIC